MFALSMIPGVRQQQRESTPYSVYSQITGHTYLAFLVIVYALSGRSCNPRETLGTGQCQLALCPGARSFGQELVSIPNVYSW